MNANENLAPATFRRIAKELTTLMKQPPEGVRVIAPDGDMRELHADITGPEGTPYAGGTFRMKLVLEGDFPQAPPKGYFVTKIFHPNVSRAGEICVNTLKRDWQSTLGLEHVFVVVRCLLIAPNAESALNEEAGKLLLENYDEYAKQARLYTSIHAKPAGAVLGVGAADGVGAGAGASGVSGASSGSACGTAASARDKEREKKATQEKKKALRRL